MSEILIKALQDIVGLSELYPPCKGKIWDDENPCGCDGSNSGDTQDHGYRDGLARQARIAREALGKVLA